MQRSKKKPVTFNIDRDLLEEVKKLRRLYGFNASHAVNTFLRAEVEKYKKVPA